MNGPGSPLVYGAKGVREETGTRARVPKAVERRVAAGAGRLQEWHAKQSSFVRARRGDGRVRARGKPRSPREPFISVTIEPGRAILVNRP